jgi:hypothetical protein
MSERSWGHYLLPVQPDEVKREAGMPYPWRHRCRISRKCEQPTAYIVGYKYITGRAGRTSTREQTACEAHGKAFAEKHGLTFPPVGVEPVGTYPETWPRKEAV